MDSWGTLQVGCTAWGAISAVGIHGNLWVSSLLAMKPRSGSEAFQQTAIPPINIVISWESKFAAFSALKQQCYPPTAEKAITWEQSMPGYTA